MCVYICIHVYLHIFMYAYSTLIAFLFLKILITIASDTFILCIYTYAFMHYSQSHTHSPPFATKASMRGRHRTGNQRPSRTRAA